MVSPALSPAITIEPARLSDAEAIHRLVTFWADRGDMLHRPISEVYEAIRDFKVARIAAGDSPQSSVPSPQSSRSDVAHSAPQRGPTENREPRTENSATARSVVAVGSLHIMGPDLAEVRSLAVEESAQTKGLGAAIVAACVADAREMGIERVFALTYKPGFFEKQGFRLANVMEFPQKVWNECVRCPFFTNCKEIAVVLDLRDGADIGVPVV